MPGEKRNPIIVSKEELKKFRPLSKEEVEQISRSKEEKENLTPEQALVLKELFGEGKGKYDALKMPTPGELTDEYFEQMYPPMETKKVEKIADHIYRQKEDTHNGLISFRPGYWDAIEEPETVGPVPETTGQAFIRSVKVEANNLAGKIFYTETIQKPIFHDGCWYYGTREGKDPNKDHILPMIMEIYGEFQDRRHGLTWDQITTELLPKIKEKIKAKLIKSGKTSVPDFDIILTPALISNIQMTKYHPENSWTYTAEWTSTPLYKQDNTVSDLRWLVGNVDEGGAGFVNRFHRSGTWGPFGFRLSVVFNK